MSEESTSENISFLIERLITSNNKLFDFEQGKFDEMKKEKPDYDKIAGLDVRSNQERETRVELRNAIDKRLAEISGGRYKPKIESRTWGVDDG